MAERHDMAKLIKASTVLRTGEAWKTLSPYRELANIKRLTRMRPLYRKSLPA